MDKIKLGEIFRKTRERRGLSQEDVASGVTSGPTV